MVKLLFIIAVFACCLSVTVYRPAVKTEYRPITWQLIAEAEARATCVRPAELYYTTSYANCYRTVTPEKNYCPF